MKLMYLILFIFILFVAVNAQKKLTDREFDGLKGRVKSVATSYSSFENKDGKSVEKRSEIKFEEYYDENGNTTQTMNYIVGDKNIYSYIDGDKTFKTKKVEGIGGSGISMATMQESNPKPRDKRYSIKFNYKFDDKNRPSEETLYSNDGGLISRTIYKYDEKGRIKEIERYNTYKSDKLTSRTILKYDDNDNLIEEIFNLMVNGGSITERTYSNYKFDTQGNWIQRTQTTIYTDSEGQKKENQSTYYRKIEYYK